MTLDWSPSRKICKHNITLCGDRFPRKVLLRKSKTGQKEKKKKEKQRKKKTKPKKTKQNKIALD
jgi:hypothetical protein